VVSFWWRVSSEKDYDLFKYSVDGVQQQVISGDGAWAYQTFTLGAGTHQIRWTYTKDGADASFDDAGYLDDLVIVDAYKDLQVTLAGAVVTGSGTLDFGTEQQSSADVARSLTLKNNGTIPLAVTATIPSNSGFAFSTGLLTRSLTINAGQQTALDMKMLTATGGQKTALLGIVATGSLTAPPAITLSGLVQPIAPDIACSWSGGDLTSGQSTAVDFGTAPSDVTFTVANTGTAALSLSTVTVSPTANFQVTSQPASTVAINGSTTFTVRALDANRGNQSATVTVASDAYNTPSFTIPVASRALLAVAGTGAVVGSLVNTGTAALWDTASTVLADGSTGLAIKTGATPNSGNSTLGATFDGPGILSWNWKVSAQKDYDWLLCEVNGVEMAGISTKTAAWQSQVLQIPAGSQVRWIYRKDAANSSGTDSGHLADIRFSKFATAQSSFDTWSAAHGGLTPTQVLPKGGMQAMFAWLGGVDPTTGPAVGTYQPTLSSGIYQYRYRVDKGAAGMTQPQVSTDLVNWDSRRMKQALISEDSTSAVIELSVAATGKTFSRLAANVPAYTPPAPAGFVYVAAGTLPSWSELSGQSVAAFYIAKTETTWGQWHSVRTYAAANGYDIGGAGYGEGTDYPVTNVNWYQVVKWCNARSEQEGLIPVYKVNGSVYKTGDSAPTVDATANGYRLPTEAQWEFAARGGVSTQNYEYSGSNDVNAVAWWFNNTYYYYGSSRPVATKQANELGVSDMSGNVWEWCESWYPGYEGSYRVIRGGSWNGNANYCRVADRGNSNPSNSLNVIGFRVARSSVQ
jgi:formylglycine-generating enzyme required for sulfatase activity